jgi:P pilus assembly chaperone PapD
MKHRTLFRILAWTALLQAGSLASEALAIVVAPTAIYLRDGDPAEVIHLFNSSTEVEEVTVETAFGYPATNDEGSLRLVYPDGEDDRSAADWIQVLPRRIEVPPGERRALRILARPPAGTPEGEYWTRLILTSRGRKLPVEGAESPGIQVGLGLTVRTVIALTYRHGKVTTGVTVAGLAPEIVGDSLVVRPDLRREGNGAYIGRMDVTLVDARGETVRSWEEQVAVYRSYHRRYAYSVEGLAPGEYRLHLRLGTDREDIAQEDRLSTPPVEVSAPVVVP